MVLAQAYAHAPKLGVSSKWVAHIPRRALPACRASVGHQQHQMDEALEAMRQKVQTQTVEPPTPKRSHHVHQHHDPHVHIGHPHQPHHVLADAQHYVHRSSAPARPSNGAVHPKVPHLDGECDVVEALGRVREVLGERNTAVVTCEESGPALFDLLSLLLLLDEDVRGADSGACVLFQPVLDVPFKLQSLGLLAGHGAQPHAPSHVHPRRAVNGHHSTTHNHQHHGHGHSHSAASSAVTDTHTAHSATHNTHHSHSHHHQSHHHVAALITQARCPKLLAQEPASCVLATTPRLDSADMAAHLAALAQQHGCTRLRAASSPAGLVSAFRALRATRSLVRAQGSADILVAPRMVMEPVPVGNGSSQHADAGHRSGAPPASAVNNSMAAALAAGGNGGGSGSSASAAQQQQQQAVMYFNIWVRPREV